MVDADRPGGASQSRPAGPAAATAVRGRGGIPDGAASRSDLRSGARESRRPRPKARHEQQGADLLRKAIAQEPGNADVDHSLGLMLVRQKNYADALAQLRKANELAPDNARYAYVYAIALNTVGSHAAGDGAARRTHRQHPADRDVAPQHSSRWHGTKETSQWPWPTRARLRSCIPRTRRFARRCWISNSARLDRILSWYQVQVRAVTWTAKSAPVCA